MAVVDFRPNASDVLADPYPLFRELRQHAPAFPTDWMGGLWLVTRYDDVKRLLRDNTLRNTSDGLDVGAPLIGGPADVLFRPLLSRNDAPNHIRLRKLGEKALSRPALAQSVAPRLEQLVDDAFDRVDGLAAFDAVNDLAVDMPLRVFCGLLDIPEGDRHEINSWMPDYFRIFGPLQQDAAGIDALQRVSGRLVEYFRPLVDERRGSGGTDMISQLADAEHEGEAFSTDEVVSMIAQTMAGGFDTSTSVIVAGLYNLAVQPEQMQLLREDSDRARAAVEEFFRWESPVQMPTRFLTSDTEVAGTLLPSGDRVACVVASANRDETRFSDPDRVDILRAEAAPIAFGGGRHFCIGNHLARMEGDVFFAKLAERYEHVELAGEPVRAAQSLQFRGFRSLGLRLHPA